MRNLVMISSLMMSLAACGKTMNHTSELQATSQSMDAFASIRGDKCERQAKSIAMGLAKMWDSGKVTQVEWSHADEDRHYTVTIENDGSISNYRLDLSNDSAYSCILLKLSLDGE